MDGLMLWQAIVAAIMIGSGIEFMDILLSKAQKQLA